MSELTQHGRKALERCIREHQKFIELADDYDLDEMSVQALRTGIESMQMRLGANAKPAAGPSEHDESWAEMMEHDYDTAVRGAVISNTVEFTDSCGCVFCDLKCHHSIEDCKLIALLEDVAVQHEGLENYGDSCGPSMCIRACRGAIAALKATHPQPVTPAMVERLSATVDRIEELNARQDERGRKLDSAVTPVVDGESFICYLIDNCEREVIHEESLHEWLADFLKNPRYHKPVTPAGGEVATVCVHDGQNYLKWTDGDYHYLAVGTKLYTQPPVADAALAELLAAAEEARSILGGLDYYDLRRRLEYAIAAIGQPDASLPRGHRISDARQVALVRDAERFRALAKVVTHIKVSYAEPNDCMDDYLARMADAALNQRGG